MNTKIVLPFPKVRLFLAVLALGLCLYPGIGSSSVYDTLKQEKESYTLPIYPSDYGTEKNAEPTLLENSDQLKPTNTTENRLKRVFYPDETRILSAYDGEASKAATLLSGNWHLKDLEALVLLRNAGIQSAALNVRSARDGYSQVNELNDILTQYSAFTEGLKPGVGPRKGSP
ncbi:MAG: hypothetical protein MI892_25005, partial [Desulfobacterales bacterium]|nr:hypothetical protein [Desulfobacterales bacterium]